MTRSPRERAAGLLGSVEMATRRWRRWRAPMPPSWSPSGASSPSSTGPRPAERMTRPLIVDGRNFLDPETLVDAGFEYEGIGRARVNAPSGPMPLDAGYRPGRRRGDPPATPYQ